MFVLFSNKKIRKVTTRRALLVGGIQAALVCAIGGRLAYLQTRAAENYFNLAESNRIDFRLVAPQRGLITDRNGIVLAENKKRYLITIVPEQANDLREVLWRLSKIVPMSKAEIEQQLDRIKRHRAYTPLLVADDVSWEQVAAVSVNSPALPGVYADYGSERVYPVSNDFSHVVGYVGRVSQANLDDPNDKDPLLHLPRFHLGKTGVERSLEKELRGNSGTQKIEVNAFGRVIRELDRAEPVRGQDVQLSLESELQTFANARLGSEAASVVVMDVITGEILVMASTPNFDPNRFVKRLTHAEYQQYLDDDRAPLFDRCWQGLYPPGSTIKPAIALAALHHERIDPGEQVTCDGAIERFGTRFHCWKSYGHGRVDLPRAISESCDVYFYKLAERLGFEVIAETAKRFGLGIAPRLPVPGPVKGVVPDETWIEQNVRRSPRLGDLLNASIGQGYVLVSALQLAIMTSRLATGRVVVPRLINSLGGTKAPSVDFPPLQDKPEGLELIRGAMFDVVNTRQGTAYSSRCIDSRHLLAGKTGTSQVRNISRRERERGVVQNEDLPWERRDHALFCGYIPGDKPKYAVSVIVEHGGSGSKVAAPIARDILLRLRYGHLPPLTAYPPGQRQKVAELWQSLQLIDDIQELPVHSTA